MAYECAKPQLLFFEPKGVQYSILHTEQIALKPLASIDKSLVLQFNSMGYSDDYRNLSSVYLHLKVKMNHLDDEDKPITAAISKTTLNVYPVNNLLHSLFRQVTLTLNNKMVASNSQNYAYR